ncbi:Rrn10p SCDLUD_001598 [Saccharomycodes ludwigii]|uniref:Rrn10p n=1 Tax=Saccharomycodes ludwigii TaxID=36035 RepID=UPI001E8BD028|nr:hypothetical protein SCDLUD_001598 [Saccharomycodes ludwigii]KAH3901816.1 hypothetical protein SCDLUD_001598 [Saccharomycodes ludwigii]
MSEKTIYDACNDLITELNQYRTLSADEVLSAKIDHLVPIPFVTREEFEQYSDSITTNNIHNSIISSIDLRVLQYFLNKLITEKYPTLLNSFDETSLLTLGILIESWIAEYSTVDDDTSIGNEKDRDDNDFITDIYRDFEFREDDEGNEDYVQYQHEDDSDN